MAKTRIKPLAETPWKVTESCGFYFVRTKDARNLNVCRTFSYASARLICKEHNAAITASKEPAHE